MSATIMSTEIALARLEEYISGKEHHVGVSEDVLRARLCLNFIRAELVTEKQHADHLQTLLDARKRALARAMSELTESNKRAEQAEALLRHIQITEGKLSPDNEKRLYQWWLSWSGQAKGGEK